jgi:hypothetical protein
MAITQVAVQTPAGEILFTDSVIGAVVDAIKASSALALYAFVDNSGNASATYVKFWNLAAGSVTLGTTVPDEVIYVPGLAKITHMFFTGAIAGKTFNSALSAAAVTTGGTAGVAAPASAAILTVAYI